MSRTAALLRRRWRLAAPERGGPAAGPPHDDAAAPGALKESAMRDSGATGAHTGVGRA
jgi:hypothetical protein